MAFPGYVKPSNTLIDAGVLYVGDTPVGMGATRGGLAFNPGREMRHIEFDGRAAEIQGLHRKLRDNPRITGRMIEFSNAAIGRYEPGGTSDGSSGTNTWTPKESQVLFSNGDYLEDVTLIYRGQDGKTYQVKFAVGLVVTYSGQSAPDSEVEWEIEIAGVLPSTETDLNASPYVWEVVD